MPFDQYLPISIPRVWQPPFYSLFLWVWLFFFNSVDKWYHTVFVFLWLISHSIISTSFIHVVTNGIISFFFYDEIIFCLYTHHIFFIHSSINTLRLFLCLGDCEWCCREQRSDGSLSFFCFLATHCGLWDLSFLILNWTWIRAVKAWNRNN